MSRLSTELANYENLKRDYGTDGNNGKELESFRLFRYFRLFRNLSSGYNPRRSKGCSPSQRFDSQLETILEGGMMKNGIFAFIVLFAFAALFAACEEQTTINRLNGDPARYRGKKVLIVGTVTNSFGALGQGAYELNDETGKIWVITQRGVPAKGARVGAVGKFMEGVKWGGRSFGSALEETDRKVK